MKKFWIAMMIAGTFLIMDAALLAQASEETSAAEKEFQLLRKDIRSMRKQLVAANLPLTDEEAIKFWPIYDQYMAELTKINDARLELIKDFAANYDTLTDEKAASLLDRSIKMEEAMVQVRVKYSPLLEKVIPARKNAMFFQIDRRLGLLIELQLVSQIPLVDPS